MVFQWRASLVNCFRYYKMNFKMLFGISLILTICELAFLTMMYHTYWIVNIVPVYLLFFVFLFQYALLNAAVRLEQTFIACTSEFIKTGRAQFKTELEHTRGRFLRGIGSSITVLLIVFIPGLAYFLTLSYIDNIVIRAIVSSLLLIMVFFLSNSYQYIQVAAALESKVVNEVRISTAITNIYFKETLLYSFALLYWLIIPIHIWLIHSKGHIHFCGCSNHVLCLAVALTILRPLWMLLKVQVYTNVKKMHFPVPEMDPDLRDRNII